MTTTWSRPLDPRPPVGQPKTGSAAAERVFLLFSSSYPSEHSSPHHYYPHSIPYSLTQPTHPYHPRNPAMSPIAAALQDNAAGAAIASGGAKPVHLTSEDCIALETQFAAHK